MDEETKKATARALEYLAGRQNSDGSWSDGAYIHNTAITAYAMLMEAVQLQRQVGDPRGLVMTATHAGLAARARSTSSSTSASRFRSTSRRRSSPGGSRP